MFDCKFIFLYLQNASKVKDQIPVLGEPSTTPPVISEVTTVTTNELTVSLPPTPTTPPPIITQQEPIKASKEHREKHIPCYMPKKNIKKVCGFTFPTILLYQELGTFTIDFLFQYFRVSWSSLV
ncbi:unnamed protein product, partial [Owenia fusiformis]